MTLPPIFSWLRPWAERRQAATLVSAYRQAFAGRAHVLADLAALCHAQAETYVRGDPHETAFNEGRRAVWLHIQRMLDLTDRDLRDLKEVLDHDRHGDF